MTGYQCGSCSYESNNLDGLRLHGQETGHVLREFEGAQAAADAKLFTGRSLNHRTVAKVVLAAAAAGLLWKYKGAVAIATQATARADRATAMATGLLTQLAEAAKEIDYLKSASGAGKTLVQYRGR